jgi:hypothetical protein
MHRSRFGPADPPSSCRFTKPKHGKCSDERQSGHTKQQALAANQQRQVEIRRDTEKLAELTQELKEDLLKSDHGVISVDTLKRAEQIEKLAHSVKSKMKQSF